MAKKKKKPPIHEDLEGFDISVNPFGELESTLDIEKINEFLNKNVKDKKLPDPPEEETVSDEEEDVWESDELWEEEE